jgi:hypothetical protein
MKTANLTLYIKGLEKIGNNEERFTTSFSSNGSLDNEEPKNLNQIIDVIQNDLIDTIIIDPLRVSGKSLGIILNVLSQRNYQLKKAESKQIKSDRTLIDTTLDNPSALFDHKIKLGNQDEQFF